MKTLHLMIDANDLQGAASEASLSQAAEIIRSGGTVAFPTETVYGLGANALDEAAVARIFEAKQRPSWDPLIVHISDHEMLHQVVADIPSCAQSLMDSFWPGPLTLLMPRHSQMSAMVTAGRARIGVRIPAHPVALELIRLAGVPIAAPSANLFGHVSPTSAAHVLSDLDGSIDAVLDGGQTQHGLESTVVDACQTPVIFYRPGVISLEQIAAVCGSAKAIDRSATTDSHADRTGARPGPEQGSTAGDTPSGPSVEEVSVGSPGMALRHYAPRAHLLLIEGNGEAQRSAFYQAASEATRKGERVGLMLPVEFEARASLRLEPKAGLVYRWGQLANAEELARGLFAGLRRLDAAGATVIVCPLPADVGLGTAIRDRLQRAVR